MVNKYSFKDRHKTTNAFIELLHEFLWKKIDEKFGIKHFAVGYENLFPEKIQNILRKIYDRTSIFIRFLPDYMIVDLKNKRSWFIEYKVTRTPRYSEGYRQWSIGQVEANAWENYIDLQKIKVKVIVCVFCPYHKRPLLCSYPKDELAIRNKTFVKTSLGSGTPYINLDLEKFEWFHNFISRELGIPKEVICKLLNDEFWGELRKNKFLQVKYHPNTPETLQKEFIKWDNPCG